MVEPEKTGLYEAATPLQKMHADSIVALQIKIAEKLRSGGEDTQMQQAIGMRKSHVETMEDIKRMRNTAMLALKDMNAGQLERTLEAAGNEGINVANPTASFPRDIQLELDRGVSKA